MGEMSASIKQRFFFKSDSLFTMYPCATYLNKVTPWEIQCDVSHIQNIFI